MSTVLVVESSDGSSRAYAMAKAFLTEGTSVFVYNGVSLRTIPNFENCAAGLLAAVDLVLLHSRDELALRKLRQLGIKERYVIRYSGGGARRDAIVPDPNSREQWIRDRSVSSSDDVPSTEEAQQILEWVNTSPKVSLPPILFGVREYRYLPALKILCEGYLAVEAASDGASEAKAVQEARQLMGWNSQKHNKLMRVPLRDVQSPEYWLRPLGLGESLPIDDIAWQKFVQSFSVELGREHAAILRGSILESMRKGEHVMSVEAVAGLYLAMTRR